jgi:hypothetical protein
MRYSTSIILLLVLSLFALTACGPANTTNTGSPFIGGSKALDMTFVSGAPPKEIYDNKQGAFQVTVQVKNVGEADLSASDGYIKLEGIAPQEFGVSSAEFKQDMPAIRGARKTGSNTIVTGLQQQVSFGPLTYQNDINGNIASNKIIATACYNYITRSTSDVCVKKSGVDDSSKKSEVCKIEGVKSVANSAGPLQITKVSQVPLGDRKIQIQFQVGRVGTGNNELFFKKDTMCDDVQTNFDRYKVYVNVKPIVNELYRADCTGWQEGTGSSGYITLYDGIARDMQCTFDVGNTDTDFQTNVNFELEYRYMQQISSPILIKDFFNIFFVLIYFLFCSTNGTFVWLQSNACGKCCF